MDKNHWLQFLSSKIKSQIALEASEKNQTWAFALFGFGALSFGLGGLITSANNPAVIYGTKVLFLIFFHLYAVTQFFIPGLLQPGQRPIARQLQLRDFVSLVSVSGLIAGYSVVVFSLAWQSACGNFDFKPSGFLAFTAWANAAVCAVYAVGAVFYILGLFAFPGVLAKVSERKGKAIPFLLSLHGVLLTLTALSYSNVTRVGSPEFFEELRSAGLFWIFMGCSLVLAGRLLRESAVGALSALEMDLISGRLERLELIPARVKEAFVSSRFDAWLKRYAKDAAFKAAEIARLTREALALVNVEKPSEMDLRQVEIRYHKAEALYKHLDKNSQRVNASLSAFYLSEVENEKAGLLHDHFSRELRNAKLELASMRKRIDERLVSLKNSVPKSSPLPTASEAQTLEELTLKS